MITHRGFSAWISSEGRNLPTFEPNVDTTENKISCWVPSEEGKAFTVHWQDHGGGIDTAAYIYLDGYIVPGQFLYGDGRGERSAVRVENGKERPFTFAKPEVVQPQLRKVSGKGNTRKGETGIIMLKIKQVKRTRSHEPNKPHAPPNTIATGRRSRTEPCIGFGPARTARPQKKSSWYFEPYDSNNPGDYVTFVFRYRSPDFLIDQGIASESELEELVEGNNDEHEDEEATPAPSDSLAPQRTASGTHSKVSPLTPSPSPSPNWTNISLSRTSSASYGAFPWDSTQSTNNDKPDAKSSF
ncbi:hypothetical protein ABKN59_004149 [Abortiporus biennis]